MASKYDEQLRIAIDEFWREHRFPPTLRDLMEIVGISSTSTVHFVIHRMDGVRVTNRGRIIPKWVDNLFDGKKTKDL